MDIYRDPNLVDAESMVTYLLKHALRTGQAMKVGVVGPNATVSAGFVGFLWDDGRESEKTTDCLFDADEFVTHCTGVVLSINGNDVALPWGDLITLRPVES